MLAVVVVPRQLWSGGLVGGFPSLEACLASFGIMKAGPRGGGVQISFSSGASGPCF